MKMHRIRSTVHRYGKVALMALLASAVSVTNASGQALTSFSDQLGAESLRFTDTQSPSIVESLKFSDATDEPGSLLQIAPSMRSPTFVTHSGNQPVAEHLTSQQFSMSGLGSHQFGSSCSGDCGFSNECEGCGRRYYVTADYLLFNRAGNDGFTLSQNNVMPSFGYESSVRGSLGLLYDCLDGVEIGWVGPLDWNRARLVNGTGLQSNLTATDGYIPAQIETYNNAVTHSQTWRSHLWGVEANRRWWAWDIMSTYIGLRAIDYEEDYTFDSVAADGGLGFYRRSVDNFMLGGQAGFDMIYPMSRRFSFGTKGRIGLFANFNEGQAFLANRGTTVINALDKDVDFSAMVETGLVTRYRLLPSVVLTGGYETWYLINVATVPGQSPQLITPAAGGRNRTSESVFFHGLTAGVEISF